MPLIKSGSEPAFKTNVRNLMHEVGSSPHVQSRAQALAIAYDVKRRGRASGGPAPWYVRSEARGMLHSGPVMSAVPGRMDKHNINVAAGSYVLPADHVSSLGQNNTHAGFSALSAMFGGGGPYGVKPMGLKHGPGPPRAVAPKPMSMHMGKLATGGISGNRLAAWNRHGTFRSEGGPRGDGSADGGPVPIVVAGGEYVLTPDEVMRIGGGDLKHGHEILDAWVKKNRKEHVKTLNNLPSPAKK